MKIKRFKLNALSQEGLQEKEMNAIIGGNSCGCACSFEGQGGSSTNDNASANYQSGYVSNTKCNYVSYDSGEGFGFVARPKAS